MGLLSKLFGRAPRSLMGVDIGARHVKLLELDRAGDGYRVLSYASAAVPDDAVRNFQIVDAEKVAGAVNTALKRSGSRTRDAAIAVSGPSVISKTILLPAGMEDAEMEQQIHFDAAQHIPHPIEEVNLDFQVLAPDEDNPEFNRVLLVACRRDNIEMRTAAMEMAGMKVRVVDVEEYALQNACQLLSIEGQAPRTASVAVFDVGTDNTRLTIQRDMHSLYTREVGFGARELTDQLIRTHQLRDFETLRARLHSGELPADAVATEVGAFAERLATHIDRTLAFYHSAAAEGDEAIERVVVTGTPVLYPGLGPALAQGLPWPVDLGNPLGGMLASKAARRNHVDNDAPTLMVAAGLALRSLA